jgi:hypothetical protein
VSPLGQTPKREALTLHFLTDGKEFRFVNKKPKAGDHMHRDGDTWIVVDVREDKNGNTVVTLRPEDKPA